MQIQKLARGFLARVRIKKKAASTKVLFMMLDMKMKVQLEELGKHIATGVEARRQKQRREAKIQEQLRSQVDPVKALVHDLREEDI